MGKKMFVGGLPPEMGDKELSGLFAAHGRVVSARVIKNRDTGLSKGFGFVEMSTDAEAAAAQEKLHNSAVGARRLVVNEARPMEPRPLGGPVEKKSFGPRAPAPRPGEFSAGPDLFGDKRGGRGGRGGRGDKRRGGDDKRDGWKGGFGGKKGSKGRREENGDSW